MTKYLSFIFFGIILYLLYNNIDSFSIGIPVGDIGWRCNDTEPRCNPPGTCVNDVCEREPFVNLEHIYRVDWDEQVDRGYVPIVDWNSSKFGNYLISLSNYNTYLRSITYNSGQTISSSFWKFPNMFKYELPGRDPIYLNVIEVISSGRFGTTFKYSQQTQLPNDWVISLNEYGPKKHIFRNTVTGQTTTKRPRNPGDAYISIVVKVFFQNNDPEIEIVNDLNALDIYDCKIVMAKVLNTRFLNTLIEENVVVMEYMEGTLKDLFNNGEFRIEGGRYNDYFDRDDQGRLYRIKIDIIIEIIFQLVLTLKCLLDQGYVYCDLKLDNILIKRDDDDNLRIILGDLGSIVRLNSHDFYYNGNKHTPVTTYPTPEIMYRNLQNDLEQMPRATEDIMVWQVGVVMLHLFNYNESDSIIRDAFLYLNNYPSHTRGNPDTIVSKYKELQSTFNKNNKYEIEGDTSERGILVYIKDMILNSNRPTNLDLNRLITILYNIPLIRDRFASYRDRNNLSLVVRDKDCNIYNQSSIENQRVILAGQTFRMRYQDAEGNNIDTVTNANSTGDNYPFCNIDCLEDFGGPLCEFKLCNNDFNNICGEHGILQGDYNYIKRDLSGCNCICEENFAGQRCDQCDEGFEGPQCNQCTRRWWGFRPRYPNCRDGLIDTIQRQCAASMVGGGALDESIPVEDVDG